MEALADLKQKLFALYVVPHLGDYTADLMCHATIGAEKLDCVPLPPRSLQGTMPFDQKQGVGQEESKVRRALHALPLLGFWYAAHITLGQTMTRTLPFLEQAASSGRFQVDDVVSVPLKGQYCGLKWLDNLIKLYVAAFLPSIGGIDATQRLQMISFTVDLAPIQVIWLVESLRQGHFFTFATK